MEVSKIKRSTLVGGVTLLLFLVGCSSPPSDSNITQFSTDCPPSSVIKNEFIVHWKSGKITFEKSKNKETFVKDFIEPKIDKIKRVEYNHRLQVPALNIKNNLNKIKKDKKSFVNNWGTESINAPYAWQEGHSGQDIIVAVIDDGVNIFHPQLEDQLAINKGESGIDEEGNEKRFNNIDDDKNGYIDDYSGFNFVTNSPFNREDGGHGTHVAGIIAAQHNDTTHKTGYVQGVAPKAKILPIDFIDGTFGGTIKHAIEAIDFAVKSNAKIINASWGGSLCSVALYDKIATLNEKNILFVAAAGNSGKNIDLPNNYEFPASYQLPSQITIGSYTTLNHTEFRAEHSNYGNQRVHLFAPGENIVSTLKNDYALLSGTSMATPFVSGSAAVLWSAKPSATLEEVKSALFDGAIMNSGFQNITQGRLSLEDSIKSLLASPLP